MSKKILRMVRDELQSIRTNDLFVTDAIRRCVELCNAGLVPGLLPPHQHNSETSREAAQSIAPKFGRMTRGVLALIARYEDGLTDEEGQGLLSMEGNSYRPCRVTLADRGFVHDTNIRRMTRNRKKAVVWGITQEGIDYLINNGGQA